MRSEGGEDHRPRGETDSTVPERQLERQRRLNVETRSAGLKYKPAFMFDGDELSLSPASGDNGRSGRNALT